MPAGLSGGEEGGRGARGFKRTASIFPASRSEGEGRAGVIDGTNAFLFLHGPTHCECHGPGGLVALWTLVE